MAKRSRRWSALETVCAEKLGGIRDRTAWFAFVKRCDVVVPDFDLKIDAKAYARFRHHRLFETIEQKYCDDNEHAVLVTREPGKRALATVELELLGQLLNRIRKEQPKNESTSSPRKVDRPH